MDLYDRGMRQPVPLYCATSQAWAQAAHAGGDPDMAATKVWTTEFGAPPSEDVAPEHKRVFGRVAPFATLLDERPLEDESGSGWDDGAPHRFGRLARRLWDPVLEYEKVGPR